MAGPYSAGTIFLQVVPSYADFQNALRKDAPALAAAFREQFDKELEKGSKESGQKLIDPKTAKTSGETAGKQAAAGYGGAFERELKGRVKAALDDLPDAKIGVDSAQADKDIAALRARLRAIGDAKIGIDLDAARALTELAEIRAALDRVSRTNTNIDVVVNTRSALASVDSLHESIERRFAKPIEVKLAPERGGSFEAQLKARIRAAQNSLPAIRIGAATDGAERALNDLQARLAALDGKRIGIDLSGNEALAEIAQIRLALAALPNHVDVGVRMDIGKAVTELAAFEVAAKGVSSSGEDAAVSMEHMDSSSRSLSGGMGNTANAFRTFNGLLLVLSTVGPLVVPILGAIAGGALALGPAFLGAGVGIAAVIAGFSGIQAAVTAINNKQKNAAKDSLASEKALRTSSKGVADAQRSAAEGIASALRTQEDAERSLQRAQRDSIKAQQDLVDARKQAVNDIADLNSQVKSGKLDERQALIDLFNATVANQAAQADPGATNLEKEQASIDLARAQGNIADVRRRNKELAAEKAKTDKDGVNGTSRVQNAQDALTNALQAQQDAERQLGRTSEAVNRARVDGARRVADAMAAQAEAAKKTGEVGSAAQIALDDAMAKLGPAGQHFAYFIAGLQDQLFAFRDAIQAGLLPGVEDAITSLLNTYGKGFTKFLSDIGGQLGDAFREFATLLEGPAFQQFFAMMAQFAPIFIDQTKDIGFNLLEAFANIMTALAPFSKDFGDALVTLSEKFKDWTANLADNKQFKDFLAYAKREGPRVLKLIEGLLGATLNIAEALAPYADKLLSFFIGFLDWIAGMDPKMLGGFLLALIGVVAAVQIVSGLVAGLVSLMSILEIVATLTGAALAEVVLAVLPVIAVVALIVLAVGALVIGFVIAYKKSETFRNIVWGVLHAVGDAAKWLWEKAIKPSFGAIVKGFQDLGKAFKWTWDNILFPIIDLFGAIAVKLWRDQLKPRFKLISDGFKQVGSNIKYVWDHTLGKVFAWFGDALGIDGIQGAMDVAVKAMKVIWDSLEEIVKKPIRFVVNIVINDVLIKGFNQLAKAFGTKKMSPIPLPKGFDAGGWTGPGRKYQPAGVVHADEYVIRKESTNRLRRVFGMGFLDHLNEHGTLPGFAAGGHVGGNSSAGHPFGGHAALIAFGRLLQAMGFSVTENPAFGGVHPVHAKNSAHYTGDAIDVNWAPGTSPAEQAELRKVVPIAKSYGLRTIFMVAGHYNHAHFDDLTGADMLGGGGGGKDSGGVLGFLKGLNPLDWFENHILGAGKKVLDKFGDNTFTQLLAAIPEKIGHMMVDAVSNLAGAVGDLASKLSASDPTGSAGPLGALVQQQAAFFGWNQGAAWDAIKTIIHDESGWNPYAQNPSSTAYGLFQFLDGTWGSVGGHKTTNPADQAFYGMKYIKQRYGDPVKALAFRQAHGWYSEGGAVTEGGEHSGPTLYDAGGVLPPGVTNILNASGKPEAILTNAQWKTIEGMANTGGQQPYIDARSYGSDLDANDVADEILWAKRRTELGGRYAAQGPATRRTA